VNKLIAETVVYRIQRDKYGIHFAQLLDERGTVSETLELDDEELSEEVAVPALKALILDRAARKAAHWSSV
jgi:hypothetical protein